MGPGRQGASSGVPANGGDKITGNILSRKNSGAAGRIQRTGKAGAGSPVIRAKIRCEAIW